MIEDNRRLAEAFQHVETVTGTKMFTRFSFAVHKKSLVLTFLRDSIDWRHTSTPANLACG